MLADSIVVNDGTNNHTFSLVSREGMNSMRREIGVSSELASMLQIKNTVDLNAPTKPNRHLISFSLSEKDATTGELYPISVHAVIARHKSASDSSVKTVVTLLSALLGVSATIDDVLIGGN